MANSFSSRVDILFENIIEQYNAMNVTARNVSKYKPGAGMLQEDAQTFFRPVQLMSQVVDGRDISSSKKDLTQLTVPATLSDSHIRNVPISLTGVDLNNPHVREQFSKTAGMLLSNKVDSVVADAIADQATLAVVNSGNIDTYDDVAVANSIMTEQQAINTGRKMFFNPRMAQNVAGNLAGRQTLGDTSLNAYERSRLPMIATFDTFSTDYQKTLAGSAGTGYLVNGANQHYTPLTKTSGIPVDNRTSSLVVDTGSNAAVGDVFTIANVYAVGGINKQSTGQLRTFRIMAINGATWTVSPAIIPADGANQAQYDYATVNTTPADNAAITILNSTTKPVSTFCDQSAVEILHSDYSTEDFSATGKKVRSATTDSGLTVKLVCDSNIETFVATYRMFIWMNVTILNPLACGILLEGQV